MHRHVDRARHGAHGRVPVSKVTAEPNYLLTDGYDARVGDDTLREWIRSQSPNGVGR